MHELGRVLDYLIAIVAITTVGRMIFSMGDWQPQPLYAGWSILIAGIHYWDQARDA